MKKRSYARLFHTCGKLPQKHLSSRILNQIKHLPRRVIYLFLQVVDNYVLKRSNNNYLNPTRILLNIEDAQKKRTSGKTRTTHRLSTSNRDSEFYLVSQALIRKNKLSSGGVNREHPSILTTESVKFKRSEYYFFLRALR
jgi:hypothetical protein